MTLRPSLTRWAWIAIALAVIAVGLAVHELGLGLPARARDVAGDALWAVMVFAWLGAIRPGSAVHARAGVALAISWAVEISQAYHTPQLDAVRQTTLGRLVLGSGFDPRDLVAYALGIAVAAALASIASRHAPAR